MDSGLLSGEAGELYMVFSLECAASLVGFCGGTGKGDHGGCHACYIAGSSTGAAGNGVTDGFMVVGSGCAAAGTSWEVAGLLAVAVSIFFRRS